MCVYDGSAQKLALQKLGGRVQQIGDGKTHDKRRHHAEKHIQLFSYQVEVGQPQIKSNPNEHNNKV